MAINSDRPRNGPTIREGERSEAEASGPPEHAIASTDPVAALVAAGSYADAAQLARERGELARAADLYERIWLFSEAAHCARDAGDLGRALANAIDANDEPTIVGYARELDDSGSEGRRTAMEIFASKRRFREAAKRAEALDAVGKAIDYYKNAHRELDAARLLERAGRDREAGRLLERFIDLCPPGEERALAQLRLGQLLARRMSHDAAARYLQEASKHDATRAVAMRSLVVSLATLGLRDAARDVLVDARRHDPELPATIEAFLRAERDAQADLAPAFGIDPEVEREQIIGGRYRLGELIGAGGAGRVFRAHDEVRGRPCAVKIVHTGSSRGNQAYERFIREAKLASALSHPNLVAVYDVSSDQGYLVMELMTGGSLAECIDRKPLSGRAVRQLVHDVLAGLELAHQRGVIHRDVKPANIFFDARGTAKLGDFGVAHLLDLGQTQTGGLIGTLAYMAPEQITGAPLSITADLYSLGVTMFESLTGRLPFLGPDFVAQHLGEMPPALSEVAAGPGPDGAGVALGWDPILARLLRKTPGERYSSIDELRRDVARVALGESDAPKVLVLHRAGSRLAESESASSQSSPGIPIARPIADDHDDADRDPDDDDDAPRYRYETQLGTTEVSHLSRAVDRGLNRTVIIERFGDAGEAEERRLFSLARGGGPFVQRALAYDREAGVAVFEAPSGTPLAEAFVGAPPGSRSAARLLKRLARAVAPLHEVGAAHGALGDTTVLIDDDANPTILVCGLGRAAREPRAADDVAAIVAMVAGALGAEPSIAGLVAALTPGVDDGERAAILARDPPTTGEELYAYADALEVALLRAWRRARR